MKIFSYTFILIIFSLNSVTTGCTIRNKFNPPKNLQNNKEKKRLIIFLASYVERGDRHNKQWAPGCTLMAIPANSKTITDFGLINNRLFMSFSYEWNAIDTGNIEFVMAIKNGNRMMARKLYTDTTIRIKDLHPGNNYWHLNYYNVRNKYGMIPVMPLREVDVEKDFIIGPRRINFSHFLTYDVSHDTATFVRKKRIISGQNTLKRRYDKIRNHYKSVSLFLPALP